MTRASGSLSFVLIAGLAAPAAAASSRLSFEDLVANLKSPTAKTRRQAVEALGKSRRREAVMPLSALVRDTEVKVRAEVVRALRELRDVSAVPALVTSMADGDPEIRRESIATLVEIYAEADRKGPIGRFLLVFSDQYDRSSVPPYVTVDPSVYQALAAALRDQDADTREAAALALGILDGRSVVWELMAALQDPAPAVRRAAVTALGKIGTAEEGRNLVPLLRDDSAAVRLRALQALAVLKVKEAGPTLREMFEEHRRRDLGLKVLETLSRIGDETQADLFQELLVDPDPDKKRLAVEGLGRLAAPSLMAAFKKDYQRERNDHVRLAYAFALARLGDRAFVDSIVLNLPSRTLGRRARGYLLEMGPGVLPDLYDYLADPQDQIRAALCDIMAAMGDPAAIPRLTPLLNDPDTGVADRANRALERLRRSSAVKASG